MHDAASADPPALSTLPAPLESGTRLVSEEPASVVAWGVTWLALREREGVRSVKDDRGRWTTHVAGEEWAQKRLRDVTKPEAREWFAKMCTKKGATPGHKRRKDLAANTIQNTLNLVRRAFEDAIELGYIPSEENVFEGLKIRRSRKARTEEAWTVVLPNKLEGSLRAVRMPERAIVAVAIGTCARQGELWGLRLTDVQMNETSGVLILRHGGAGGKGPTKGGRVRRIPLFGMAFRAMQQWLSQLEAYCPKNPLGLVFPRPDGRVRPKGAPRWFDAVSKFVGESVRWHDLRHTGATLMLAGWLEGPTKPTALEDLQLLLGHASITMTERYAHWLDGHRLMLGADVKPLVMGIFGATFEGRTRDLRFTKPERAPGQPVARKRNRSAPSDQRVVSASVANESAPAVAAPSETTEARFARIVRELGSLPIPERRRILVALRGWFVGPEEGSP